MIYIYLSKNFLREGIQELTNSHPTIILHIKKDRGIIDILISNYIYYTGSIIKIAIYLCVVAVIS